jgi:hypothetical protein
VGTEGLKNMARVNEWAKGKPTGLVIMAEQLAVSGGACFRFLKSIKAGEGNSMLL